MKIEDNTNLADFPVEIAGEIADYIADGYTQADWAHDHAFSCVRCDAVHTDRDDGRDDGDGWTCDDCIIPDWDDWDD
jgi:hypothetical protein